MSLLSLCEWVQEFPSSIAIRESTWGYPIIETTHVLSMCLFLGLIIMMDLRLVGLGNLRTPFSRIQARLFPWQMFGLAMSVTTGIVLVYTEPLRFYGNVFFWIKSGLLVLAGANAIIFHLTTYRSVADWDAESRTPFGARLAGALSLALWAGIVVSGRLIAYNWFD
jgi:hypothetical protein